jgi:protoporphyrin/coproporphyrin ferrochelatase
MNFVKGVILINLGTPKTAKVKDVFSYLIEFLTDKRVIDYPWLKRQLLVRGLIVPFRCRQSAALYREIWTDRGSPLLFHSQDVEKLLQEALGSSYIVSLAMRYQVPSIPEILEKFRTKNLEELIVLPLFPQYASATTGSVYEKVMDVVQKWEYIPKIRFINDFHDDPGFIAAFCARARQYDIAKYDHVLFSFHGLPERQIRSVDPAKTCLNSACCQTITARNRQCYKAQCYGTANAIVRGLGLQPSQYSVCFQSRLGKEPWIQPYAMQHLQDCAKKGYKKLLVFSPSFVCDCLETISEISVEYDREFRQMGGEKLQLVEGLNSHPLWIEALRNLVVNS